MKITLIGSSGAYADLNNGTSCYLVEERGTKICLDFGDGALGSLEKYVKTEELSAVFLTHLHFDHISGLFTLSYKSKEKMKLYLPSGWESNRSIIEKLDGFEITEIKVGDTVSVGELMITVTPAVHKDVSVGYIVSAGGKTLYYSGDTELFDGIAEYVQTADVSLIDVFGKLNDNVPHMSLADAKKLVKETKGEVIAVHLHPDNAKEVKEGISKCKNLSYGYKGRIIEL